MVENVVQDAGAEGVSGTSGLDGILLKERGSFYTVSLVVSAASVFSKGDQDKGNVIFAK